MLDASEVGTPIIPDPGMPIPYIAAILGSIAAIAAIKLEFGFFGSNPRAVRVTGSIFKVFGSIPRAVSIAGSNFLGSIPIDAANISWAPGLDALLSGLDFGLSPREVGTEVDAEDGRESGGCIPIACSVFVSIPIF